MDHYTEFISLIHDFIDLFRSLTTVEQQKLDAAVANDLPSWKIDEKGTGICAPSARTGAAA